MAVELLEALVHCRDDVLAMARQLRIGQAELDERRAALGGLLAAPGPPEAGMPSHFAG